MPSDSDSRCDTKILPPRLAMGQCLKHFQLESVLGEGGMGVVYRANDTQLCRPVAVKVLPFELTSDPDRKQRFLQEARAAARINHPAVAQIFYVDEQDGVTFIVMELVEGKTVRELIQGGGLDLLGVIDIVIQAAEGLARAHELGIVHRDIKPANVMVTNDGHVKILDFGLAKLFDRSTPLPPGSAPSPLAQSTLPGVVMGTAAYMSPEQVRGIAIDGRADVFSLGVLLFEMATGQSPFQRENFMDSLHAVAFENPPSLTSLQGRLPEELQRIVSRCLRKDPGERYPDARLFARDLRELRRNTEAGVTVRTSWRVRLADTWERILHLPPSQYAWLARLGRRRLSLFTTRLPSIGTAAACSFASVRTLPPPAHSQPAAARAGDFSFGASAKIPEVRLDDRAAGGILRWSWTGRRRNFTAGSIKSAAGNRKLYFGEPLTVSILHGLDRERTQQLLSTPGVQFVREDVLRQP